MQSLTKMNNFGYAIYQTEFGNFMMCYENDVIVKFKKIYEHIEDSGTKTPLTDALYGQLLEYLSGKRKSFDFKYRLYGTDFQKKVWNALCDIPYGETRSYKDIAIAIGNPKASRAIGMANNKNPITIAVPCHRVIGSSGKLVGYAGGLDMKTRLLEMEKNNK